MPSLDLSRDYLMIHDPITVSYQSKTAESVWAAGASVDYVQRNSITKADVVTNPSLLERDATVFHLWTARLNGIVPKLGDVVDSVWLVQSVEECDRDANGVQRYRCICLRNP